jgi:ribonucleoside-diphosphate reductase alpha chain
VFDQFIEGNYKTAEPGLIFWSTMSKYSPSNYVGKPIICTNPCAEVPLEDGGACNLGSLNLSCFVENGYESNAKINWDQLAESTAILIRFLDNVVTWNEDLNALEKQRRAASETRRLGLGIMGVADMLNQLGIGYDSEQGMKNISEVMEFITNAAYQAFKYISDITSGCTSSGKLIVDEIL